MKLARVIDGDTIVVRLADGRAERVRIAGIDTAELSARCREEERLALTARTALAAALASSPGTIRLVEHGRDRYDRLIADVLVDGEDVGRALVALGIAREWTGRREPWC
ncbi:thermonuclease family protein [Acuticoccus sp. M5D2P5]|uniref:thermonuclease family protein n=1 Tax=Acuticoccus kalidii TaxID=2910977 RepID=UPI001F1B6876|nr:thermonuclease family protein [Acuticoccus kalidii]